MPNWKNAKTYEKKYDRTGWCWQFMRRDPRYRADFALIRETWKEIHRSGHFLQADQAIRADQLDRQLSAKWAQFTSIANPADDINPPLIAVYPIEPNGEQVDGFYYEPDESGEYRQRPEFATLTFDVRRPLALQMRQARSLLRDRKKVVTKIKRVRASQKLWRLYLRVLDAKEAKANSDEIIATIPEYKVLAKVKDAKYPASDRLSDHYMRAQELRDNALSIIV